MECSFFHRTLRDCSDPYCSLRKYVSFHVDVRVVDVCVVNARVIGGCVVHGRLCGTVQTTVGPGFKSTGSFTIAQTGTGDILVLNLSSKTLNIAEQGTGGIFVQGLASKRVVVNAQGTGDISVRYLNTDIDSLDATTTGC